MTQTKQPPANPGRFNPILVAAIELLGIFVSALRGLGPGMIVVLAVDEDHEVGVLFDRSGIPQIGKLRPLVLALFEATVDLRDGDYEHIARCSIGCIADSGYFGPGDCHRYL